MCYWSLTLKRNTYIKLYNEIFTGDLKKDNEDINPKILIQENFSGQMTQFFERIDCKGKKIKKRLYKSIQTINAGEGVEKSNSYAVGGNAN